MPETRIWRLRPHHLYCERFSPWSMPQRGESFNEFEESIRQMLQGGTTARILVIEGVDDLCRYCYHCRDNRCQSPDGDEAEVRKWDVIVLKGLGIAYGKEITAGELRSLVDRKSPLAFCREKCPSRAGCAVLK